MARTPINESTVTVFLARLSLDHTEQGLFFGNEASYLAQYSPSMVDAGKIAALTSRNISTMNNAALAEQGAANGIKTQFQCFNVATYSMTLPAHRA